jgi:hypothetical protein
VLNLLLKHDTASWEDLFLQDLITLEVGLPERFLIANLVDLFDLDEPCTLNVDRSTNLADTAVASWVHLDDLWLLLEFKVLPQINKSLGG